MQHNTGQLIHVSKRQMLQSLKEKKKVNKQELVSKGNKLPVGEQAGGTAASVPAHTEGSGVSLPPPHQSLHAAATHNPELAGTRTHIHTRTHTHKAPSETSVTCSHVHHSLW